MLFSSLQYILFLPVVVLLFWIAPKKWRTGLLLIASYFFYMSWIPAFILLIAGMTLFNWLWGNLLCRSTEKKKLIFGTGVAVNLLCLAFFKYTNFVLGTAAAGLKLIVHQAPSWHADIILPLGISFFAFEFIHYLFEIYRGGKPIKSILLFALFAAFFPTQIAGPIKRYKDFETQMLEDRKAHLSYFDEGLPLIIIGMAKKMFLADNLGTFVQMGMTVPGAYGAPELWLFAYAFAFQIYFDFSGYTDIARGSALLFGYHIPINFKLPYVASNMADFWRRWHISLSSWLRDYLFIPLGGSRQGRWFTHRNLFLTMAIGGLWHGASWNFVVWGIYHGLALIVHREFSSFKVQIPSLERFVDSRPGKLLSIFITFHAVCVGWIFFRMQNIGQAFLSVKRMLLLSPVYTSSEAHHFLVLRQELPVVVPIAIVIVFLLLLANLPLSAVVERGWIKKIPAPLKAVYCTFLILAMVAFIPDKTPPFIYFQF